MAGAATVNRIAGAVNANPLKAAKKPSGVGLNVEVEVDPFPVNRMLGYVLRTVDGASLARWLVDDAHEYFREEIAMRFAYEGDKKSGAWAPLHDATIDIRRALGYGGDSPINERTGELFDFVTTQYDINMGQTWALLTFPGDPPTASARQKLETAQLGRADNPLDGYGPTTRRPVLAVDETDLMELMVSLESYIMLGVVGRLGD